MNWPAQDYVLLPCPKCGKEAKLSTQWQTPLFGASYACNRWFLRPCIRTKVMWNVKDWGDLAIRRAKQAWCQAVEEMKENG